ncbi:MAG: pectin esterase [Marinilabiliaceae bacterium]|nr:pectin esterase [Marinilabiliaceae bacterium]
MRFLSTLLLFSLSQLIIVAQPNAPDIVVAQSGKADFRTIQDAINAVRDYKPTRTTIFIRNGTYNEKLLIPANKCDITIIGESKNGVRISYGDFASLNDMGTFKTSTVRIDGDGIRMENLTIENTAGRIGQAVALHVEGDKCEFANLRLLGNQDTLFNGGTNGVRHYFKKCYIEGTTDFIFGPATVWMEECHIHCKADSYITAASTPAHEPFGYIFNKCRITVDNGVHKVYLGRPWREYAAVIFMNCELPLGITGEGWHNWGRVENQKTSRFAEYNCTGEGADRTLRVEWSRTLSEQEAASIILDSIMVKGSSWSPAY